MSGEDAPIPSSRRRNRVATIYDVAVLAGVSPSTVSRALSQPGRISAPTQARIRDAVEQLNFRFNPMARALPTGRSRTIALLVADITNPVVFGIVRGAEGAAKAAGYTLVVAESQESGDNESEAIDRIMPSVDGIVLATTRLASDRIRQVATQKPVVLINRDVDGIVGILPDIDSGVTALLGHLVGLGHRSIAYLAGPEASWISEQRFSRMLDATERLGVALVEIGPNTPTIEGGRAALRRVIAARSTAAVAFNDLIAIGLMQAAALEGIRVPADLSVAGFDDIFGSELITPRLTTVRAQLVAAGERAVASLLSELAGDTAERIRPENPLLPTSLIVRQSTGAASEPFHQGEKP